MTVKVKICGVCSIEDARHATAAGADFLGLNFHPQSPRHVDVAQAAAIAAAIEGVQLVGVFVDAPRARVEDVLARVGLQLLQFHGRETPADCQGWGRPVIKAIRPQAGEEAVRLAAAYDVAYILVDSYVPGQPGGTGVPVDPTRTAGLDPARLFLAGGLRPETVAGAVRAVRPFAVDVASGVEARPGKKDHAKVESFIRNAKSV